MVEGWLGGMNPARVAVVILVAFFGWIILLLAGCSHREARAVSRPSADVAIVRAPVEKAQQITERVSGKVAAAKASVSRAQALADSITLADPAIDRLKLELSTTQDELTFANDEITALRSALAEAVQKSGVLETKVKDLGDWGVGQQERADHAALEIVKKDKIIAEKDATIWNRNKWIFWLSIALAGAALWIFRKPIMMALVSFA